MSEFGVRYNRYCGWIRVKRLYVFVYVCVCGFGVVFYVSNSMCYRVSFAIIIADQTIFILLFV